MRSLHPAALSCLRTAEMLATIASMLISVRGMGDRRLLANDGMAAWRGHRHPRMDQWIKACGMGAFFTYPASLANLCLKMLTALAVLACILTAHSPRVPLLALVLLTSLWHLRLPLSVDGGDQLCYLTLIAATMAEFLQSETAALIALAFIAAQAALAYATAGFLKLKEKGWYNGAHIEYVLSTATFGDAALWRFIHTHRGLARIFGSLFVLCECLLPFAALLPPPACALVLCGGVVLHATIARVLGLNTFFWAYGASYPATYYLSTRLYTA